MSPFLCNRDKALRIIDRLNHVISDNKVRIHKKFDDPGKDGYSQGDELHLAEVFFKEGTLSEKFKLLFHEGFHMTFEHGKSDSEVEPYPNRQLVNDKRQLPEHLAEWAAEMFLRPIDQNAKSWSNLEYFVRSFQDLYRSSGRPSAR